MKIFSSIFVILLSLSLSEVSGQNQRIRDLDHVFTIDLTKVDAELVDQLKEIRYVSVVDHKSGSALILKSSQDESTRANEKIRELISNDAAILEQKGAEYLEK